MFTSYIFGKKQKETRLACVINRMRLLKPSAPMDIRKFQVVSPTGTILEEFWNQGDAEKFMKETLDYLAAKTVRVKLAKDVATTIATCQVVSISGYIPIKARTVREAVEKVEKMLLTDSVNIGSNLLPRNDPRITWGRKLTDWEADVPGTFGIEYSEYHSVLKRNSSVTPK